MTGYRFRCIPNDSQTETTNRYWKTQKCTIKHNILMRYYICNIFSALPHSYMILYLRDVLNRGICMPSLEHMHLFIIHTIIISVCSFIFPLRVLYIRHRSVSERQKRRKEYSVCNIMYTENSGNAIPFVSLGDRK